MKLIKVTVLCAALALSGLVDAKGGSSGGGGHSSGGGGHSSMSGGGRSSPTYSSTSRPNSPPSVAPTAPVNRPNSAPVITPNAPRPNSAPVITPNAAAPRTTTTTTTSSTTMTRRTAGGGYAGGGMMYGGMGMGFGYTNGLLTGLIIGNMMHPHHTTVYTGGGYNGNALLYPDGRVVNQQGYQVGNYANGQFSPVNGGMVAQQAPADALQYQNSNQAVVLEKAGPSGWEIAGMIVIGILCILLFLFIIGVL